MNRDGNTQDNQWFHYINNININNMSLCCKNRLTIETDQKQIENDNVTGRPRDERRLRFASISTDCDASEANSASDSPLFACSAQASCRRRAHGKRACPGKPMAANALSNKAVLWLEVCWGGSKVLGSLQSELCLGKDRNCHHLYF